jgi:hypothetical protein
MSTDIRVSQFFIIKSLKIIAMRVPYLWILIIDPKLSIKRQSCWTHEWQKCCSEIINFDFLYLPCSRLNCIWMSSNTKNHKTCSTFIYLFFEIRLTLSTSFGQIEIVFQTTRNEKKYIQFHHHHFTCHNFSLSDSQSF